MTAAIFGLIGVIVGVVVAGAVDLYMARRHEKAAVFKAKRLVGEELQTIWMHLDNAIEAGTTPQPLSDERRATSTASPDQCLGHSQGDARAERRPQ